MSGMAKDEIESYSVDYRKEKLEDVKRYNVSKTVVAGVPSLKSINVADIKIKEPQQRPKRKNSTGVSLEAILPSKAIFYRLLFACAVLLLSIIGCVIFVSVSSNIEETLETQTYPSGNFSNFLSSVVMHDPEPFSTCDKADKQMIVSSGIWRTIAQNGTQKYDSFDENGRALIPFEDVFKSCQELFGQTCKINQTETIYGPFYTFSSNDKYFHVSAISNQDSFLPYIEDSWEENDLLVLKVGYLSRSDEYFKLGADKSHEPNPVKYMKYIMKKNDSGNYYIFSIETV